MKNTYTFIIIAIIFASCNILKIQHSANKILEKDGIAEALAQEIEMTKDPVLGLVPKERLLIAKVYKDAMQEKKTRGAIAGITWTELGPTNQAGRSRCAMVDLSDTTGETVWVGSVGGGIWKTTNISNVNPNWTSNAQFLANIAIGSIAQDPINKNILYLGTGELISSYNAVRGFGIFKSIDGGNTWNQLSSTNNSNFYYSSKILVLNSGIILAGTVAGLYRSTNGGNSWTKVLGNGISGASSDICYDIEQASNGTIFASVNGTIHQSTNAGVSFGSPITLPITASRIEIACAPSDSNFIYLLVENAGTVNGILQSTNGGTSFTSKTEPADLDAGIPATDFSRGQAWYDLSIAVHPADKNRIYVGGIDLFTSTNGGGNWQQFSHWYGDTYNYVHADQHGIIFSPFQPDVAYFVNDGGIDRTNNASAASIITAYKGNNYNTIQFYSCAMNPTKGKFQFLGGAQDNGSQLFSKGYLSSTVEATGGDGGFCHIDQNQEQYQFTAYVYNNFHVSTDTGNSFVSVTNGNTGRFINPTDYDDVNNRMYCARASNEYLLWSNPQAGNTFTTKTSTTIGGQVSAIKVSPNTNNRIFLGTGSGTLTKVDNANATPIVTNITGSAAIPTSYISCVEVENGNDNHILITYSNYGVNSIWETKNGGSSWTSVEGNLPDIPVRWILLNPNNNKQALIATELGVWSTDSLAGNNTVWAASNSGLANVRVNMLQTRASDKLVIAASNGRGLFSSDVFTSPAAMFDVTNTIGYIGQPFSFQNTSFKATSYNWNFGDGTISSLANPIKTYTAPGIYTVKLIINGGADSIIKIGLIRILPTYTAPYTLAQGGNMETNLNDFANSTKSGTPWQSGNSNINGKNGTASGSFAWVTGLTAANYTDNSESYLYTPQIYLATTGSSYYIQFKTKYTFEPEYDGFVIDYSTDSGKTWHVLGSSVIAGWYDYANSPQVSQLFPASQAFFNGPVSAYTNKIYDLTPLSGKKVAFRFKFVSDQFTTDVGAAVDDFEIIGPFGTPLYLSNINLTSQVINNNVSLHWNIPIISENQNMQIQKSTDGINFQAIGEQNTNGSEKYTFADNNAFANSEKVYYRIAMYLQNQLQYSNIEYRLNTDASFIITPNPFQSQISISNWQQLAKIKLMDANGKVIFSSKLQSSVLAIPNSIPNGVYFLELHIDNQIIKRKVEKRD